MIPMAPPSTPVYTHRFFSSLSAGARRSADVIVPLVLDLLQPMSVVDVGCGTGEWLAAFRDRGVDDVVGIDGDYVRQDQLQIPTDRFITRDLTLPLRVGRGFDLAVSVEVAEHLPTEFAARFVQSLTELAPVILFSAAVPQQGGINHVNEQWPDYWVAHFEEYDYIVVDAIRPLIWKDTTVEWWYAQNILVFVRQSDLFKYSRLDQAFQRTGRSRISMVHPRFYSLIRLNTVSRWSVRQMLACMPMAIKNGVERAIRYRALTRQTRGT